MTAKTAAPGKRTANKGRAAPGVTDGGQARSPPGRPVLSDERLERPLPQGPTLKQSRLLVGRPDDRYEREADAAADRVLRMPASSMLGQIGRDATTIPVLQAKGFGGKSSLSAAPATHIRSLGGAGHPLPVQSLARFEPGFGYDFSQVRIHNGTSAAKAADSMHAKAFTVGRDIVFGRGQYAPENPDGRRLLAHELAHVVQQQRGTDTPGQQRTWVQRSPAQAVSPEFHFGEFSGHDGATDDELQRQLREGDVSFFAIYQDDRAREIVRRWLDPSYPQFRHLNTGQRTLLIRQMLSGATLDDDERAILELLSQRPSEANVHDIIETVGRSRLLKDLHGPEDRALRGLLQSLDSGAPDAEVEQCRLAAGEATPQCDPRQPAERFQLAESGIGRAIFAGLDAAEIPNPFPCNLRQAVIALLPHSATFLQVAQGIERRYFCTGGSGLSFRFHADPRLGSHFQPGSSTVRVDITGQSSEHDRVELIRTLVHEIVHASHTGGYRGRNVARSVESRIAEEAETRTTENTIMGELLHSSTWTTLVGRQIADTDLEQSGTDLPGVRRDFVTGLPRLTYVENFATEAMLGQTRGALSDANERRMTSLARRLMALGLVPDSVTPGTRRSFDFSHRSTRSALRRQLQRQTTPRPPERPAPPARVEERCIAPFYATGRPATIPTSVSTNCRAFLTRYRSIVDSANFRSLYGERHGRTREAYQRRIYTLLADMRSRYLEYSRWEERRQAIETHNRPIQEIIDAATGSNRRYFEWVLIREAMSREWNNTPGTSGGTITRDQAQAIGAIRTEHLRFLQRRIGSLAGYTYRRGRRRPG